MPTLGELARVLGGVIEDTDGHDWLDTTIGDLRAAIIRRHTPITDTVTYDIAVFTPDAQSLDPFDLPSPEEWRLDEDVVPRLRHGYVYAGCRAGVLFARSPSPPSLEQIVGALWDLADWARKPWREPTDDEMAGSSLAGARRRRRVLFRVAVVALVVALVVLIRR